MNLFSHRHRHILIACACACTFLDSAVAQAAPTARSLQSGSGSDTIMTILVLLAGAVLITWLYFDEQKRLRMEATIAALRDDIDLAALSNDDRAALAPSLSSEDDSAPLVDPSLAVSRQQVGENGTMEFELDDGELFDVHTEVDVSTAPSPPSFAPKLTPRRASLPRFTERFPATAASPG